MASRMRCRRSRYAPSMSMAQTRSGWEPSTTSSNGRSGAALPIMAAVVRRATSSATWSRSIHVGNVANVAYGYAKILIRRGAPLELICHDINHLMSQPEWDDLALDPKDFPDENDFRIN